MGLGVAPGWHCLEIGASAGSIAKWLAERTGSNGRTVATDLDIKHLDPTRYEVWRHDLLCDELPATAFDLVHLRHVLIHVDQAKHAGVLRALWNTLKPGGLLLAEESDLSAWHPCNNTPEPTHALFADGIATTLAIYRSRHESVIGGRNRPIDRSSGLYHDRLGAPDAVCQGR